MTVVCKSIILMLVYLLVLLYELYIIALTWITLRLENFGLTNIFLGHNCHVVCWKYVSVIILVWLVQGVFLSSHCDTFKIVIKIKLWYMANYCFPKRVPALPENKVLLLEEQLNLEHNARTSLQMWNFPFGAS